MRYWVCPRALFSSVHNETTLQCFCKISSEETKLVSSAKATHLIMNSCKNGHFAAHLCLSIILTFTNLGGIVSALLYSRICVNWRLKHLIYTYGDLPIKIGGSCAWFWVISQSVTLIKNFTSEENKTATEPQRWIFSIDTSSKNVYILLIYRRAQKTTIIIYKTKQQIKKLLESYSRETIKFFVFCVGWTVWCGGEIVVLQWTKQAKCTYLFSVRIEATLRTYKTPEGFICKLSSSCWYIIRFGFYQG